MYLLWRVYPVDLYMNFVKSSPWKSEINYDWYRDHQTHTYNYIYRGTSVCAKNT